MKKNTLQKGFTLIELLVVVAIIVLLATTILGSLSSARAKAKVARAQSEMSSMRAQNELYRSTITSGKFEAAMFTDTTNQNSSARLWSSISSAGTSPFTAVSATGETWVATIILSGTQYCVDANGYSGKGVSTTFGGTNEVGCLPQ